MTTTTKTTTTETAVFEQHTGTHAWCVRAFSHISAHKIYSKMSYLAPLIGAAGSVAPLLQSRQQHIDELRTTHALHERAIEQARELHDEQVQFERTFCLQTNACACDEIVLF